jgi:hypothetical protein
MLSTTPQGNADYLLRRFRMQETPCNCHGDDLRGPDLGVVERRTVKLRTKTGWDGREWKGTADVRRLRIGMRWTLV